MLTGDNGILTQAKNAKEETRGGTVQEARDLWFAEKKMNKEANKTTEKTLEDLINELVNDKYLTEDEKDIILGNASKGIEAQYQITIGSHVINFKDDENSEPDYANLEAGLYETGTSKLIKSWEQLLSGGDIEVYDSCHGMVITKISPDLEGDFVIKEGINGFYDNCFNEKNGGNARIKTLVIPSTAGDTLYEEEIHSLRCDIGNITKIFIKDGVEIIDRIIGTKLKNIRLPKTLNKIDTNAFESCTSLKTIEIPAGVTGIEYGAFKNCTSLTNVKMPEKLTSIKEGTFEGCTSLKTIEMPTGAIEIQANAFKDCNNISKVKWKIVSMIHSNISNTGNGNLENAFVNNYYSYATNIINNLSTDENIRNQEITDIYIDGFTYIEKAQGNLPEDVKIESLQDLWELLGNEGQCPFNNIVEMIEAEGGSYEDLISMMIEQVYVKPKEFDQNN